MLETNLRRIGMYGQGELVGNARFNRGKIRICKAWSRKTHGFTPDNLRTLKNPSILPISIIHLPEERIRGNAWKQRSCGYL